MFETEPALPTDRFVESLGGQRGWFKRKLGEGDAAAAQAILEENEDRGTRATVAGL